MQLTSKTKRTAYWLAVTAALGALSASAGTRTWSFDTDPSLDPELIVLGNNAMPHQATTGNPGGFYAMTYGVGSQDSGILFPNIDPGMIVTGFLFECDVRAGNGSTDRPADGFSISFARDGDPVLAAFAGGALGGWANNGAAEFGSRTGISISFDTWSGNALTDGPDIEGIIVRLDDVTILRQGLPTRNGACEDATSLQTGPRDATYWTNGGDATLPEAWAGLCWQPFSAQVASDGKVTVKWKGATVLDAFQTAYFPSAGQLVFAGRTGGANMNTHIDNAKLTTTAASGGALPSVPANARTTQVGSRRVALAWDASTIPGGGSVAYEISRNGVVIAATVTATTYDDRGLSPNTAYTYAIRAKNIAGNLTDPANVNATTVADVQQLGIANYSIWANIGGTAVDAGLFDPHYADPPDRTGFGRGIEVGQGPTYGSNPEGDNYLGVMKAVVTVPTTGSYRFFISSDDASNLYIDGTPVPPDPVMSSYVAQETACCAVFQEPFQADGFTPNPETTEPIALTAGQKLGVTVVWKEGGGGDGVGVGWRLEGDTTPAASLPVIGGGFITGNVDGVGSSVTFTQQPVSQTVSANQAVILEAAATGASPYNANLSWHWYKNDQPLGARQGFNPFSRQLVIPFPSAADAGSYKVLAFVTGAAVFSEAATLTVNADTVAPTIVGINGSESFDTVTLTWSEPVTEASAETAGNYTFTGGLTVTGAELINSTQVRLTTSAQTAGATYTLTANGVRDTANNASAASAELKAFELRTGVVNFGTWRNQTGAFASWIDAGVRDLPPTTLTTRPSMHDALPDDSIENYFGRLWGFFTPATSGNYVFFVSGDDVTELYLSTDADPANKVVIAREPSWSNSQNWIGTGNTDDNSNTRGADGSLENRSDQYVGTLWPTGPTITLQQGQRYYIEVLYKEGGGGDHGAATFIMAGGANPVNGTSALTGDVISAYVDPAPAPLVVTDPPRIVSSPTHQVVDAGATATFSVTAQSILPLSYQWYRNNKPIAGADQATLTINNVSVANIGDYRVRVSNANGAFESQDNNSRLTLKNAFVVEAEDYNHSGGQSVAAASTMPLAPNLYSSQDGVPDVDFHLENQSTADPVGNGNAYRNGWNNGGTPMEWPGFPDSLGNVDIAGDNGQGTRPDFTLSSNYKVGWGGAGEWYQYTRNFPPGNYQAVFYGSRDGRAENGYTVTLSLVTGDITQPAAAATLVGEAIHDGTGGWSSNDHIPFLTPGSAPASSTVATFALGANTTVRLGNGVGDSDLDAILFYKVDGGGGEDPTLSAVRNADGSITLTFTGVLEVADSAAGPYVPQPAITSPYTFTPGAAGAQFARSRN